MNKLIYYAILLLIVVISASCELQFKEDDYFFVPAYRTKKIDSVTVEVGLHKRYFVQNYRFHSEQFDSAALDIVCQAINDSISITYLDFTFVAGFDAGWYKFIGEYVWTIDTPNKIRIRSGESPNYRNKIIPFDCELNENYRKKE